MFTQADRLLSIATGLSEDAVLMTALAGQQALSQLFHFQLDLISEQPLQFDHFLKQDATTAMVLPNGDKHCFNGIVSETAKQPKLCRSTEPRVPSPKHIIEFVIEHLDSDLQQ